MTDDERGAWEVQCDVSHHLRSAGGAVCIARVEEHHDAQLIGHVGYPGFTRDVVPAMKRAPNTVTETAGVFRPHVIQETVDEAGAERVLMGSHFPSWPPVTMMVTLISDYMPQLSEVQKKAILGGNFARIFSLKE